jgi:hypothetical protein
MWRDISVSLNDLLFSVSEAMDLADPSLNEHQIRTGFVAGLMARAAGIDYAAQEKLFLAALLHDIGALSPEEKLGIHSFEHTHPEQHCVRGQRLFEETFWLAPDWISMTCKRSPRSTTTSTSCPTLSRQKCNPGLCPAFRRCLTNSPTTQVSNSAPRCAWMARLSAPRMPSSHAARPTSRKEGLC